MPVVIKLFLPSRPKPSWVIELLQKEKLHRANVRLAAQAQLLEARQNMDETWYDEAFVAAASPEFD